MPELQLSGRETKGNRRALLEYVIVGMTVVGFGIFDFIFAVHWELRTIKQLRNGPIKGPCNCVFIILFSRSSCLFFASFFDQLPVISVLYSQLFTSCSWFTLCLSLYCLCLSAPLLFFPPSFFLFPPLNSPCFSYIHTSIFHCIFFSISVSIPSLRWQSRLVVSETIPLL